MRGLEPDFRHRQPQYEGVSLVDDTEAVQVQESETGEWIRGLFCLTGKLLGGRGMGITQGNQKARVIVGLTLRCSAHELPH